MMLQTFLSMLLQLSLLTFASALPVSSSGSHGPTDMQIGFGAGGGVVGLILLVLHVIVFVEVVNSNRPVPNKVLWCLLVFLFPIGGLVLYGLFANRAEHRPHSGYEPIVQN